MLMATEPSALRMMKNGPGYDQDQKSTFAPSIISGGCFILFTERLAAQRPPNAVGCSGLLTWPSLRLKVAKVHRRPRIASAIDPARR